MEETIQALIDIVKRGKALYIGISKYPPEQARIAYEMLAKAGVPCLISQYRYSMFDRAVEAEILPFAAASGSGFIAFSPLAQGLLTDKYLNGIPEHSRRCPFFRFPATLAGDTGENRSCPATE